MDNFNAFFKYLFRLAKIKQWIDENDPGALLIPFSACFEQKVNGFIKYVISPSLGVNV